MGAEFNTYALKGTKEEVLEKWNNAVEESQYEDGHSYSGGVGMLGCGFSDTGKVFDDRDSAEQYIEENQEKWSGAMAVKFKKDNELLWLIGGWCSS